MSKKYRFTYYRKSIFQESFDVEADSLEEANVIMNSSGGYPDPVSCEWVDWYDNEFVTDPNELPEPLCPLHKMIQEYNKETA